MSKLKRYMWMAAGAAAAFSSSALLAREKQAAAASSDIPGWNDFIGKLQTLPARLLEKLPPSMQADPHIRQEVVRLALESLAAQTLQAISGDGDHPVFLPQIGQTLNIGQPNADTIYRYTPITPGGVYRLRGIRGSAHMVRLAQMGPGPADTGAPSVKIFRYDDLNALPVDKDGRYDVILSPDRPAGHKGEWWQLDPAATALMVRMVSADWSKERDPTLSIERLDAPAVRPRVAAADLEARLRHLPDATAGMALLLVDHVEQLRQEGYVNRFKIFDVSNLGALTGQFYYEGAYDLADDEALLIEAKVPDQCGYYSMILTNDIYETTDWYNNHSSLNNAQLRVDADGMLRIVISAKDPGVPNWLDTAGHPQGAMQGRWTDCSAQPIPTVKKVPVADVRRLLPSDTPLVSLAEREQLVRDRRAHLQQRPLW